MAPDWLLGCGVCAHADQLSYEVKSLRLFGISRTGRVSQLLNRGVWPHASKFAAFDTAAFDTTNDFTDYHLKNYNIEP